MQKKKYYSQQHKYRQTIFTVQFTQKTTTSIRQKNKKEN